MRAFAHAFLAAVTWIECDACTKWRLLADPSAVDPSRPFECTMLAVSRPCIPADSLRPLNSTAPKPFLEPRCGGAAAITVRVPMQGKTCEMDEDVEPSTEESDLWVQCDDCDKWRR